MEIILYQFKLLSAYIFVYTTGTILLNSIYLEIKNEYSKLLYSLIGGIIFIVCVGAIILTGGKTVLIILLLLCVYLYVKYAVKKSPFVNLRNELKSGLKPLLVGLIPLLTIFIYKSYIMFSTNTVSPVVINMDSLKQVIRAAFLMSQGVETLNVNYLSPTNGVDPYHYFEAWLIGIASKLTFAKGWLTEQLIVVPLVSTVIVTGVYSFLKRWNAPWIFYILGIFTVNFSPVFFDGVENIPYMKFTNVFFINAFDEWKGVVVSMAYMPVILFFNLLIIERKIILSLLVLLFLPIMSITLAPGILSIVTIVLFLLFIMRKSFSTTIGLIDLATPFIVAIALFSFYEIFGANEDFIKRPSMIDGVKAMLSLSELKTRLIILVEKVFQAIILFSPVIIVAITFSFVDRNKFELALKCTYKQILIITIISGVIISSFFWMVLYGSFGSSQFLFYTMSPFTNILSVLILFYVCVFASKEIFRKGFVLWLCLIFVFITGRSYDLYLKTRKEYFDEYSIEYVDSVVECVGNLYIRRGLKFEDPNDFVKFNDTHHLVGDFLTGNYDDLFLTDVSKYRMYKNKNYPTDEAAMFLPKLPLATYDRELNKSMAEAEFIDYVIDKEDFSFVLFAEDVEVPDYIKGRLSNMIEDVKTGEKMYLISSN